VSKYYLHTNVDELYSLKLQEYYIM